MVKGKARGFPGWVFRYPDRGKLTSKVSIESITWKNSVITITRQRRPGRNNPDRAWSGELVSASRRGMRL